MKKVFGLLLGVSFFAGIMGGALGSLIFRSERFVEKPSVQEKTYLEESAFTNAIEKVKPSVVSIILTKDLQIVRQQPFSFNFDPFNDFFGQPIPQPVQPSQPQQNNNGSGETRKQRVGGGSGFIVSKDGLVITNRHVVSDDQAEYTIVLSDGQEFPAKIVSKDPLNDLGLLKILPKKDSSKLPDFIPSEFGDSSSLKVGQRVLAIGNALAEYQNTVTAGIVSALDREVTAGDGRGSVETLSGLLQTDAAINPGNSGGPLVNLQGQVIGVNVAVAASANGIGFAIPVDDVKPVLASVEKYGKIVRPILGVRYMILTEDRAKELKLSGVAGGALLVGDDAKKEFAVVSGGPAEKAGLKKDDVILEVDGKKIGPDYGLQEAIRNKKPGDKVVLKVWSGGKISEKTLELGKSEG